MTVTEYFRRHLKNERCALTGNTTRNKDVVNIPYKVGKSTDPKIIESYSIPVLFGALMDLSPVDHGKVPLEEYVATKVIAKVLDRNVSDDERKYSIDEIG